MDAPPTAAELGLSPDEYASYLRAQQDADRQQAQQSGHLQTDPWGHAAGHGGQPVQPVAGPYGWPASGAHGTGSAGHAPLVQVQGSAVSIVPVPVPASSAEATAVAAAARDSARRVSAGAAGAPFSVPFAVPVAPVPSPTARDWSTSGGANWVEPHPLPSSSASTAVGLAFAAGPAGQTASVPAATGTATAAEAATDDDEALARALQDEEMRAAQQVAVAVTVAAAMPTNRRLALAAAHGHDPADFEAAFASSRPQPGGSQAAAPGGGGFDLEEAYAAQVQSSAARRQSAPGAFDLDAVYAAELQQMEIREAARQEAVAREAMMMDGSATGAGGYGAGAGAAATPSQQSGYAIEDPVWGTYFPAQQQQRQQGQQGQITTGQPRGAAGSTGPSSTAPAPGTFKPHVLVCVMCCPCCLPPLCEPTKRARCNACLRTWSTGIALLQIGLWVVSMLFRGLAPFGVNPMLGPWPDTLDMMQAKNTAAIIYKLQAWRLLTPIFLHAGLIHLAANVLMQLRLGLYMELSWGAPVWLAIYFGSGIAASLWSALLKPESIAVGSSGALMGVVGAWIAHMLSRWGTGGQEVQASRGQQLLMALVNVVIILSFSFSPFIDWSAHLGGLLSGGLLGLWFFHGRADNAVTPVAGPAPGHGQHGHSQPGQHYGHAHGRPMHPVTAMQSGQGSASGQHRDGHGAAAGHGATSGPGSPGGWLRQARLTMATRPQGAGQGHAPPVTAVHGPTQGYGQASIQGYRPQHQGVFSATGRGLLLERPYRGPWLQQCFPCLRASERLSAGHAGHGTGSTTSSAASPAVSAKSAWHRCTAAIGLPRPTLGTAALLLYLLSVAVSAAILWAPAPPGTPWPAGAASSSSGGGGGSGSNGVSTDGLYHGGSGVIEPPLFMLQMCQQVQLWYPSYGLRCPWQCQQVQQACGL